MTGRIAETAFAEISDILTYIARDNRPAALSVAAQIDHTIELISDFPELAPVKYRSNVRMLPVRRYPQYLIFYEIEDHGVVVVSVRHASRRPWDDEDR